MPRAPEDTTVTDAPAAELAIPVEEERLLERVVAHLATVRPAVAAPIVDYHEQMISLRDQIASARLEDVPALEQQMIRLQGIAARRAEITAEPVDPLVPYFGHLRLREKGREDRNVLIGKTTHIDAKADVRIVDWRHAPVSQIYYRYEEGSEYEETFGDRELEGQVLARRTVTIDRGELLRVSAPQGVFVKAPSGWSVLGQRSVELSGGQGSAVRPEDMAAVARAAAGTLGVGGGFQAREDRHLPEIAALLDPRQFDLISRPESGVVVVQGGAGSGKTTIGIHRMAFLAYGDRHRFTPDKMLVIVGSPALRAYIGQVLPALGIGGVTVETFSEWAHAMRVRTFPWLEVQVAEDTPSVVTRYKTHPAMLHLFEERARELGDDPRVRRDSRGVLWFWADVLTDQARVEAAFAKVNDPELSPEQVRSAWRWCADRCPAVLDLDPGDRAERRAASAGESIQSHEDHEVGADGSEDRDDHATLDPEDDALLLRAFQLLKGELRKGKSAVEFEHLFVDEAQDLSALDLSVLLGIVTEQRSVTLAGDTSQRLQMDSGFRDWRGVLEDLGLSRVEIEPLRIAYRSTREVLDVACALLGPLADPTPPIAPRHGAPVEHHRFPSAGAAVAFLGDALRPLFAREPRATVGILARHPEQADVYFEALEMAEIPNLRRVRHYDFGFKPGVEVTEIRQVKGLEYDYVVIVDVNESSFPENDESRYLLHIAATRAAHQLWILSTGTKSPLLPDWLDK